MNKNLIQFLIVLAFSMLALDLYAQPANNLCSNATSLPCGTSNLIGTTVGATNIVNGTGCTISNYGVWYTFTGDGTSTTITSIPNSGYDHEIAVSTGSCGALTNQNCVDGAGAGGTESVTFVSTNGLTYYVYIGHYSSTSTSTSGFDISRTCVTPTCSDGIQNQGETGIDCGGPCPPCPPPTCSDGIQNQGETGIDCGGPCPPCPSSLVPTACSNTSQTLTTLSSILFYDDGGPGGNYCGDQVGGGNYCNCNCFTTTTICGAPGEFVISDFREFAMWNTTSGWDWMKIYDGPNTGSPVLYDNSSTGANNPFGDCGIGTTTMNFCSTGNCLTFEFWATSVVNRGGWDALVSSVAIACTLPVEFTSFTGRNMGSNNILEWTTSSEINNNYFIVQASNNSGSEFIDIGIVQGSGNSTTIKNYSFIDKYPTNKLTFYRLKQVDFDGQSDITNVIAVKKTNNGNINIYPNPANNNLFIDITDIKQGVYNVIYVNVLGKTSTETIFIDGSKITYQLNKFSELDSGIYLIKVVDANNNNSIKTDKIIKR